MRDTTRGLTLTILAGLLAVPAMQAQLRMLLPDEMNARLAGAAVDAASRGPVTPIPLTAAGNRTVGVIYDRFLQGVAAARAQAAAGSTVTPDAIASHPVWQRRLTVVVAYPMSCDGKPNQPLAIRFGGGVGPVPPTLEGEAIRGRDAAGLLPGVTLPDEALVAAFRNAFLLNTAVEVDYASPFCSGASHTASLAVRSTLPRELLMDLNGVRMPAEFASVPAPATVRMHALLDSDGRVRFSQQVQGPPELGPAATAILAGRRFEPVRVNGAATADFQMTPIVFTATGERAQPAPFVPPPGLPGQIRSVTSLVAVPGGRPAAPPPGIVPPAPPGQIDGFLARLAIELARKGDPRPVPLDSAGPVVHGVLYDRFLVAAQTARALMAGGAPLDPESPPPTLMRQNMTVVAYPLACGARRVRPTDVRMAMGGTRPGPVRPIGEVRSGADLSAALPGAALPEGAIGRAFANPPYSASLEVTITYAEAACPGGAPQVTLPLQWTRGASIGRDAVAKLPDASSLASPILVRLRGIVDLDGRYRFAALAEGPSELEPAAIAMTEPWRWEPYRTNGVPVTQTVIANVTFTTTGEPPPPGAAPARGTPPPNPSRGAPPPAGAPPLVTSSTIGGRPSTEFTSPDVTGLSASTSRCPIADDATYGLTAGNAIKVGGGPFEGVARQRQVIAALRGPNGEGLRIARLGTTMGPDRTLVDAYEVRAAHLTDRVLLYLDSYHQDPLKAPKGFVCAAPLEGR